MPKPRKTAEQACHFDHNQYGYVWSTTQHKGWGQMPCHRCGLFTVHVHHATGLTASQCDGVETFWAQWRAIIVLHEQRNGKAAKRSIVAVGKRLNGGAQ